MLSLRQDTKRYTARVINKSKELDISDYIDRIDISLPNAHEISSVIAKFKLTEELINDGNEVSIEVIDETGNEIYALLSGRAEAKNYAYGYVADEFNYEIKDSYNKLFNKVIANTEIFYDLFICNTKDEAHSLVHIIASKLGLKLDAVDNLTRVPFVLFKENDRWIDELQTLIEGTNSILYVKNKKLYFRSLTNEYDTNLEFNQKNIIRSVQKDCKSTTKNGVRVQYDRYKKLDNQVVFNLASKVIVDENTTVDTDVPTMKIAYITSSVANAKITEAKGYYFTSDDPKTRKTIDLKEGIHYKLESFKDTGAEVKFYNPSKYKLYIDSFEISGIPLAMYKDNESIVKASNVREKAQENFITVPKNKYIQTLESSQAVATQTFLSQIASNTDYIFYTDFIPNLEVGRIYRLCIRDIDVAVRVTSYEMILEPSNFMLSVKAQLVNTDVSLLKSNTDSLNPNREFIDLKPLHEKIADTDANLIKYNAQMQEALTRANDKLNKTIIEVKKELSQGIADNKIEIYSKKPPMNKLNDTNIGDLYIGNSNAEVLTKIDGKLQWKVISDKTVEQELNKYMQATNNKLVTVSYQKTKPTNSNVGDLWINTDNNGVWYRWNGKDWEQVDSNVRNALKKANSDIKGLEKVLETVNNTVNNKIMAKAFIQEQEPKTGMKNYDIWYKQSTNEYKVYLNKSWNPASEEDIFPALRHYASLSNAQLEMGVKVTNDFKKAKEYTDAVDKKADKGNSRAEEAYKRAGIFLSNNDEKFGAKNGTLAEVSLDKQGTIRLSNANNLLEWNVKDPKDPKKMRSKFYMGVTDTSKVDDDVYFKVGDEATGFSLELKEGKSIAKIEGKELGSKLSEIENNSSKNIKTLENSMNVKLTNQNNQIVNNKAELVKELANQKQEIASNKSELQKEIESKKNSLIAKIDESYKNADGKLTKLQTKYETTVTDVQNFKTETTANLSTIDKSLAEGNFVITGNTVFDGNASFLSKGNGERIKINGGSIEFLRDINGHETKLTQIRNIRYGTISTDSNGKGIVNFDGFRQPMLVFPTIKSANFGKNMASVFCYAEHMGGARYRFFVGGTNEDYREAKAIKNMGRSWSASNAVSTTLLGWTGNFNANLKVSCKREDIYNHSNSNLSSLRDKQRNNVISYPKFRVSLLRNGSVVSSQDYTIDMGPIYAHKFTSRSNLEKNINIDFSKTINSFIKFNNRTNVNYEMRIDILQANYTVDYFSFHSERRKHGGSDAGSATYYWTYEYKGTFFTLNQSHFRNLSITASAETSTISSATGYGEVGYIAMEIE